MVPVHCLIDADDQELKDIVRMPIEDHFGILQVGIVFDPATKLLGAKEKFFRFADQNLQAVPSAAEAVCGNLIRTRCIPKINLPEEQWNWGEKALNLSSLDT